MGTHIHRVEDVMVKSWVSNRLTLTNNIPLYENFTILFYRLIIRFQKQNKIQTKPRPRSIHHPFNLFHGDCTLDYAAKKSQFSTKLRQNKPKIAFLKTKHQTHEAAVRTSF